MRRWRPWPKKEAIEIEAAGRAGAALEPEQGLLPGARAHQARPRRLLRHRRRGGAAPPARAADDDEALRRRRRGRVLLPEAGPEERAGLARDGDRHFPERPQRDRARRQRRGPPRLGGQPRRDRLQPLAGRAAPTSTAPTSSASTSTRRPRSASTRFARWRWCVREVLADHGARGFPKTSGSRGIHVNVRIEPRAGASPRSAARRWRSRARSSAGCRSSRPAKWWKEERHGVFVDYNQNARDRTVASAYSVRPVADARVSTPLEWDEVARRRPGRAAARHGPGAARRARRPLGDDRRRRTARSSRCSSSPTATRPRGSATRPGRRTSGSRRTSRSGFSRAGRRRAEAGAAPIFSKGRRRGARFVSVRGFCALLPNGGLDVGVGHTRLQGRHDATRELGESPSTR